MLRWLYRFTTIQAVLRGSEWLIIFRERTREPAKPVAPVGVLDETEKLVEFWGNDAKFPPLDQHLFLIPDAKMLLVIPSSKDRIIARRVDIK